MALDEPKISTTSLLASNCRFQVSLHQLVDHLQVDCAVKRMRWQLKTGGAGQHCTVA